ncbi:hypothetical protein [Bacteriovorax sp. DB6_IX]|uniref:hypothetical protein n=1 Tax=Bacteriovorax sp. DB6_IX TaxID=1353530 RepID=UPI00038A4BC4|nr:hypothetical protein [Bacteriovorax sp. DB6_IX]EQC43162.1 putative lipoprotein [Bacteriovorax sp. DB6_IX]
MKETLRIFILILLLSSCATMTKEEISESQLKRVTWDFARNAKVKLYITDKEHDFLKPLYKQDVLLRESSFDSTQAIQPDEIVLKYDLTDCPQAKGFNKTLVIHQGGEIYDIGSIQFTNLKMAGCGLAITLKSHYSGLNSIFSIEKK